MPIQGGSRPARMLRISPSIQPQPSSPLRVWCPVIPIRISELPFLHQPPILLAAWSELDRVRPARRPIELLSLNRRLEQSRVAIVLEEAGQFHLLRIAGF